MDSEKPVCILKEKFFSEDHMFTRLMGHAIEENLTETYQALYYARDKHAGQSRKKSPLTRENMPYIMHPLMMACHAHAMGLKDDKLLATVLLHDVCEDCGVRPEDLPFSDEVRRSVALLTKSKAFSSSEEEKKRYYDGISTDIRASIVKALDRCNNVSFMAMSFPKDKMIDYVKETEKYVYPLLERIKRDDIIYNNAAFLIKYQLKSMIETIKSFII